MDYTIEKIYKLVGKDDCVADLTFKNESEAFNKYGDILTVQFIYTQSEREELDRRIKNDDSSTHGRIRAKYLLFQLSEAENKDLLENGIDSRDIIDIFFIHNIQKNTFHNSEKKVLDKNIIEYNPKPKGGDLGWMYGFNKRLVQQGIILSPHERNFYLACKLYFEPQNLSEIENQEIYDEADLMRVPIEIEFLDIKRKREEIDVEEQKKLVVLKENENKNRLVTLDSYLQQAGSSFKKLSQGNPEQATELLQKVQWFNERRLNLIGEYPIYMDIDSFLHIYMRHVEEFKVNQHFEHKDNFKWNENDVFLVMENIIREIDDDYQEFRKINPNVRFSKFREQSLYFQGDYYTFHIDKTGRISTFHKNRKEHEKKED